MLVNTFKIATKRVQSVGLGEEQLLDPARPNAPVNDQTQIMTLAKVPEQEPAKPAAGQKPPAKNHEESRRRKDNNSLRRLRNGSRIPI